MLVYAFTSYVVALTKKSPELALMHFESKYERCALSGTRCPIEESPK